MASVDLTIPARPEYVGVVRLAITSLGRLVELGEEKLDELRIAVSEACTNAVMANQEAGEDEPVTIGWTSDDGHVAIEIEDRGGHDADGEGADTGFATRLGMSHALLESLVDGCQIRRTERGSITRLTVTH